MAGIRPLYSERKFQYEMLLLARKIQGFTQSELQKQTGISQAHLSKIEQGIQTPTEEHIEKFSQILGFPVDFFFQNYRYLPPITPFHRKRTSLGKKVLEQAEAIANLKRIHLEKLLTAFDMEKMIPKLEIDEYGTPEKVAQFLRMSLNLPKGPIDNLVMLLEDYGVFIFLESFISMQLAGFTLIGNYTTPVIFINKDAPGDAERITLAHELGHIVMHTIISHNAEEEAWRFAAEFLMPKADISYELRKARKVADFADLKRKWKTSMAALMMRSRELKYINETQYRYLMQAMAPYRVEEPVQTPQETPTLFDELITQYKNVFDYSDDEIAKTLTITKEMYRDLYIKNDTIRLVK
jgi:Zn-dependent peptidase ImmA (M78 family)/transcriptional regulator with XRE-family HTH domain